MLAETLFMELFCVNYYLGIYAFPLLPGTRAKPMATAQKLDDQTKHICVCRVGVFEIRLHHGASIYRRGNVTDLLVVLQFAGGDFLLLSQSNFQ
jgi:hypothetical protein